MMDSSLAVKGTLKVSLEFATDASKKLFQSNVGVGSSFSQLIQASMEFTIEGRIAWVEIEGCVLIREAERTQEGVSRVYGVISDEESDSDVSLKEGDFNVEDTGICRDESDVEEVPETLLEERL
ncbi:hypothetical protein Tco_0696678 [Tanacetum coccineum]